VLCHVPSRALAEEAPPVPVVYTTEQDHRQMLEQLQISKLRPGRSPNADAPNAANYDEADANPYPTLPDLLTASDGTTVATAEQWRSQRRPEIVALLESEVYGRVPANAPQVRWQIVQSRDIKLGELAAVEHEIVGVADNAACPEIKVEISMSLTTPAQTDRPTPVLLSFVPTPFEIERRPRPGFARNVAGPSPPSKPETLIAAGWACAMLNPSSIQDDAGGWQPRRFGRTNGSDSEPTGAGLTRGVIGLANCGQPRRPEQWGALRAWAWGASRAVDFLSTRPEVDSGRVGIAGVSRYGKAALVAMAFDERIAMGLIASSGVGGTALYRRNFGESLENLAGTGAYHWMAGNYLKYSAAESQFGPRTADDLPVDSHMTIALCAPRLVFVSHGVPERGDAHWLDHQGSFMAAVAAQKVFRLLGARDMGRSDDYLTERMPEVNVDLVEGSLAWRQHDGGHTDLPNLSHFIRWADAH
ncbi:MAG: hypothetical protein KDA61_23080, partial [Planctomycetales bacterium]|nr:hypothetical protein [Planctomycetales bacterium]